MDDSPQYYSPCSHRNWISRLTPWVAAVAFYAGIIAILARNVFARFSTELIGSGGDDLVFMWNGWWLSKSLLAGGNPYFCDVQFAPGGVPMFFHAMVLLPSTLMALLSKTMPLIAAYNVVVLSLYLLAGLSAFALGCHLWRDRVAALVGGLVFMMCPYMASKSFGHLNLQCAAFLPLYTCCLLRAVDRPDASRRWSLAASLLLILFSNEQTLVFAANVTVWYFLWRVYRSRQWGSEFQIFLTAAKPMLAIGMLWAATLVYAAIRWRMMPQRHTNIAFCPELLSFLLPLHGNSLWCEYVMPMSPAGTALSGMELATYLGWVVFPLAVAGWFVHRRLPHMKFITMLFVAALVLSFGHKLVWNREVVKIAGLPLYLPMGVYRFVPALGSVVQHARYMVIAYMAMAAAVTGMIVWLRSYLSRPAANLLVALLAVAICLDYAFYFPTFVLPPCHIPPGQGRVLDPRLWTGMPDYYQTIHGRQLVGGSLTRVTDRWEKAYEAMDGIGWFFQRPQKRGNPPAAGQIVNALRKLDIKYVCVCPTGQDVEVLNGVGLVSVARDNWSAVFRVPAP